MCGLHGRARLADILTEGKIAAACPKTDDEARELGLRVKVFKDRLAFVEFAHNAIGLFRSKDLIQGEEAKRRLWHFLDGVRTANHGFPVGLTATVQRDLDDEFRKVGERLKLVEAATA